MEVTVKRFSKMLLVSMAMVIFDLMIGVVFFVFPDLPSKISIVLLGSLILIHGLFYLIRYFYDGLGSRFYAVNLITGVAAVILGLFTIFCPFEPINAVGPLFGIWMLITGCEKGYYGVKLFKAKDDVASLVTFISLLLIVMGILSMFNPFNTFMLNTRLIGIFLVCYALFEIMVSRLFLGRGKEALKLFDN
ncbi:MAG: DUF308 domain-containing protein [Bacilli bacterium]|nr:DUF308 domain-containing protein [Bacilli bacterium]